MVRLAGIIAVSICLFMGPQTAFAQSANGSGAGKPKIFLAYYKVPPGRQDDWLALFKKWHVPILESSKSEGNISDYKLFMTGNHVRQGSWDFMVMVTGLPAGKAPTSTLTTAGRIRKVFPDQAAFEKGEKERWSLTLEHWDEQLVEMDPNQQPLSVFLPVGN